MLPQEFYKLVLEHKTGIKQAFQRSIPMKVGRVATSHFKENFRKGGFVNGGLKAWKPAKRLSSGSKRARSNYGTLLSGRNHLMESTRYKYVPYAVTVYNDVHYAVVHNEGLRAGRGVGFGLCNFQRFPLVETRFFSSIERLARHEKV